MRPLAKQAADKIAGEAFAAVEQAGLIYVSDERPGIVRKKSGAGFAYYYCENLVRDPRIVKRIRALAVPPAYRDVWICPNPNGHIQATGRDERGRKQYRYHTRWVEARDETKYHRMIEFAHALQDIRLRVDADMNLRGLTREKVLATIVNLLETTLIRIGNEDYAKANKSYGLTTLRSKHVELEGGELRFEFKGKSGKIWRLSVRNRRVARIVRACQDLPGQHLFQYLDSGGSPQAVTSSDINDYLRAITQKDFTAKDFRTWAGTLLAALALGEYESFESQAQARKNIKAAIERVAARLGNTPAICRRCYVHPEIFAAYLEGDLSKRVETELRQSPGFFKPEEAAVLALLLKRLRRGLPERKAA